jgi:hypothetical protein
VHDPRRIALAGRVELRLKDGTCLERSADTPRGSDANFAPDADTVGKFEKLAVHALPQKRVAELRDAVLRLEQLADAAELAALMAT